MIRRVDDIGQGLTPARAARPISAGEAIHVVGVAGAGASAAALLAAAAGAAASGCDPGAPSPYTDALAGRSIEIASQHSADHVVRGMGSRPSRLAVTKALTSVDPDHPELRAARQAGIPVEPWQQVVADAAASQAGRLIAVAGTHGKSTSAGWLVHMLVRAGRDPGAFVGALLPAELSEGVPATARWGSGDAFVVEADEYAGNFDPYRPSLVVILNVDWDHPDVFADRGQVVDAFESWLRQPGAERREVIVNTSDAGGAELADRLTDWGERVLPVVSGKARAGAVSYQLEEPELAIIGLPGLGDAVVRAELRMAGRHNAANAACVAAAAARIGLSADDVAAGLASFEGVSRRLDVKGEPGGVLVIDDYGHHPTSIRATIDTVRARYPGRPLWVAHEPLTFHRAAAMLDELAAALATADHVVIADIWAGRDRDTTITSAAELAAAVARSQGREVAAPGSVEATADYLAARVRRGDIVLAMGGGRSYIIAERLVALLGQADAE